MSNLNQNNFSVVWTKPPRGMARAYATAQRAAFTATITHWHSKILPKHFEFGAYAAYGYKKRKVLYDMRKSRLRGHRSPNVWTGKLRRDMLKTLPPIRHKAKQSWIFFSGLPRYTYILSGSQMSRNPAKGVVWVERPNKPKELVAIGSGEPTKLAKVYDRTFKKLWASMLRVRARELKAKRK